MLDSVMVNIVLNVNERTSKTAVNDLINVIKENLRNTISLSEECFIDLSCDNYFQQLKNLDFKVLPSTVITITKNYNKKLMTGSHSDRFHSLELSERNMRKPVINIQLDTEDGIQLLTFSIGDTSELVKQVVEILISSYHQFDKQLALEL